MINTGKKYNVTYEYSIFIHKCKQKVIKVNQYVYKLNEGSGINSFLDLQTEWIFWSSTQNSEM